MVNKSVVHHKQNTRSVIALVIDHDELPQSELAVKLSPTCSLCSSNIGILNAT